MKTPEELHDEGEYLDIYDMKNSEDFRQEFSDDKTDDVYYEQADEKKHRKSGNSLLLTFLQIGACAIILGGAYVIRLIGGNVHATVGTWFYEHYNQSVFTGADGVILPFADIADVKEQSTVPGSDTAGDDSADDIRKFAQKSVLPLKSGSITSAYGKRETDSGITMHKGIDIAAEKGSEIYAAADGKVITAKEDSGYGNYLVIEHNSKIQTLYAHCSRLNVKQGDKVKAGEKIGFVGDSGNADGSHLHFELICGGKNTDPMVLFGDAYPCA